MSDSITKEQWLRAKDALHEAEGNMSEGARLLALPRTTFRHHLLSGNVKFTATDKADIERPYLPSELPPNEELVAERIKRFQRTREARDARKLIPIKVNLPGPICVVHMGDPHVDDDGTDLGLLAHHLELVKNTKGMFGANVGDMQNNWVGRLSHLWGQQSTSGAEAWALTEWLVTSIPWLYLVGGNHDIWSGVGDPIKWMIERCRGIYEWYGVRLALQFPNGREVRVNARHDFKGHSQWNPAHGVGKAVRMGWRDHILTCGHKHVSGWMILKDPANGMLSHAIRVGSYKVFDRYADEKNLTDENLAACATVIDPDAEREEDLVTPMWSIDRAAEFVTYLRKTRGYA